MEELNRRVVHQGIKQNKINSVSPNNKNAQKYKSAAQKEFGN